MTVAYHERFTSQPWRRWYLGGLMITTFLLGCDSATSLYQVIADKEKVYRFIVDGERFIVPRKYSPKSVWASDDPEGKDIPTPMFNYSFVYPQMISWGEAQREGISHEQLIGGMFYVDRHPGDPNPWMMFGFKEPGDPRGAKPVQYAHIHDFLRGRATNHGEKQECLSGGEYNDRLGMTRYVLNDTPEHHPSYYSEIYIKGNNTCAPAEWLDCDKNHCKTVVRYRDRFAIEYRFNKRFLYEHLAVRQAIFDKMESFRKTGKGDE